MDRRIGWRGEGLVQEATTRFEAKGLGGEGVKNVNVTHGAYEGGMRRRVQLGIGNRTVFLRSRLVTQLGLLSSRVLVWGLATLLVSAHGFLATILVSVLVRTHLLMTLLYHCEVLRLRHLFVA